jgi:hypothetical protein
MDLGKGDAVASLARIAAADMLDVDPGPADKGTEEKKE